MKLDQCKIEKNALKICLVAENTDDVRELVLASQGAVHPVETIGAISANSFAWFKIPLRVGYEDYMTNARRSRKRKRR